MEQLSSFFFFFSCCFVGCEMWGGELTVNILFLSSTEFHLPPLIFISRWAHFVSVLKPPGYADEQRGLLPGGNGTGCLSSSLEWLCYLSVFNSMDFLLNVCLRTNSAGQQRKKTHRDFKRGLAQCLNAAFGRRSCSRRFLRLVLEIPLRFPLEIKQDHM